MGSICLRFHLPQTHPPFQNKTQLLRVLSTHSFHVSLPTHSFSLNPLIFSPFSLSSFPTNSPELVKVPSICQCQWSIVCPQLTWFSASFVSLVTHSFWKLFPHLASGTSPYFSSFPTLLDPPSNLFNPQTPEGPSPYSVLRWWSQLLLQLLNPLHTSSLIARLIANCLYGISSTHGQNWTQIFA
jgi:hypothetical protein